MPLGFNASWRKPNEREDMHKLHKLTAFLSLVITLALSATGHACTDNRPTGQAGHTPVDGVTGTYVTAIFGTGTSSVRVWWRIAGLSNTYQTDISLGSDTGIVTTANSGWKGVNPATRVTQLQAYRSGNSYYWMINGDPSRSLEFTGPGIAGIMSVGSGMSGLYWTGGAGVLKMIRGGTTQSWSDPNETLGRFEFFGKNSSGIDTVGYAYLFSADECEPPLAAIDRARRVMLARSFFPELETITRQWWDS